MENAFKKVNEGITRLYSLHENHVDAFDHQELPDLEKQSMDREVEVAMLMKNVDKFVQLIENQPWGGAQAESMILALNDRVTVLLEQNKTLEAKVNEFRNKLKNNMRQISQGKKAISSYRSSAAVSNSPKVISITNY